MSIFVYSVLKSSWRVYVELDADWRNFSEFVGSSTKISEKLFFSQKSNYINERELEFLKLGLRLAAKNIDELFKDKEPIVVITQKITFNICDYQEEGLACAILGWISQEFNINVPDVDVSFDKPNNRYVFRFPNSDFSQTIL